MIPQLHKVLTRGQGFLAIMARPRSGDWLAGELGALQELGVTTVASLLEPREEAELELTAERELTECCGMRFLSFPIADRGVPPRLAEFSGFVAALASEVENGRGVAVHCRAGIGRSGITAAAVLVRLGVAPDDVFATISKARGLQVPDTEAQIQWFHTHFGRIGRSRRDVFGLLGERESNRNVPRQLPLPSRDLRDRHGFPRAHDGFEPGDIPVRATVGAGMP
jgi:protein-tyrosine phosphatase